MVLAHTSVRDSGDLLHPWQAVRRYPFDRDLINRASTLASLLGYELLVLDQFGTVTQENFAGYQTFLQTVLTATVSGDTITYGTVVDDYTSLASQPYDYLLQLAYATKFSRLNSPQTGAPGGVLSLVSFTAENDSRATASLSMAAMEAAAESGDSHCEAVSMSSIPEYPKGVVLRSSRVFSDEPGFETERLDAETWSGGSSIANVQEKWTMLFWAGAQSDSGALYSLRIHTRRLILAHREPSSLKADMSTSPLWAGWRIEHLTEPHGIGRQLTSPTFKALTSVVSGVHPVLGGLMTSGGELYDLFRRASSDKKKKKGRKPR